MKNLLFIFPVIVFLASCSPVVTPGNQTPVTTSLSGQNNIQVSHEIRLKTGVQYGSGQHTATLFADFQCPACIRFANSVMPILESYAASGRLTIVYKQYPLTTIHKNAYRDALAALCAEDQGKYSEYKKALYNLEEEKSGATVSDEDRVTRAKDVGMDQTIFSECLTTEKYRSKVDADIADGDALGIQGTPTLFFDGKKLDFGVFQNLQQIEQFFATRL